MAGFFAQRDEAMARESGKRLPPGQEAHCPLLYEALNGRWDEQMKEYVGTPYKLSVWLEGAYVKFCLGCGDGYPKFFSSFEGLEAGFEKIEECLKMGRGDWVQPKPKR